MRARVIRPEARALFSDPLGRGSPLAPSGGFHTAKGTRILGPRIPQIADQAVIMFLDALIGPGNFLALTKAYVYREKTPSRFGETLLADGLRFCVSSEKKAEALHWIQRT